jgi:flagellin-like hook-associated protein FlgL
MANTILSSGVRNNLLTLQQTSAQQSAIQNRLATGRKVNSAIDNPVNYFTSLALNDRGSQLTSLLDGISNGVQTIQAASKGIDGVTKLVQSLQSTVKQAQADAAQNRPTKAGTALANATEAAVTSKSLKDIALDKRIGGADAVATAATASTPGDIGIDTTANNVGALSITVGTTTYEASFSITASTSIRDLVNEINKSGLVNAFVDEKGQLNVKGVGSETVDFGFGVGNAGPAAITAAQGGSSNTAIGFLAADAVVGTSTIVSSNITSAVRSNLIQQFNDLRTQIDQLAKDSSFNGINLLAGDRLSITFNEKTGTNQTKLDIQGSTLTADNLGIAQAVNTQLAGFFNFQNDADLDKATASLTTALTSLRSLSSTLGSNLSVAQTRQDFTKELVNTLTTGADNLVLADSNEEGAKLLALNTRQQLSQTALSLASQADQSVLRLFG